MHLHLVFSSIAFALLGVASALPDSPLAGAPQVVDMGNGKTLPIDAARLNALDAVNESIGHSYNQASTACLQEMKNQITNNFDQSLAGDELSPKLMHCLGQEVVKPIGPYNSTTGNVR